jgi:hypothetical protein
VNENENEGDCLVVLVTTTTPLVCNASCANRTWTSSSNLLAKWLFDGNFWDKQNNCNATPSSSMPFTTSGYIGQAVQFVVNTTPMLTVPYMSLSNTSLTVDTWLYITGLGNFRDNGFLGLCSSTTPFRCLHITIRQSAPNYYLYLGFYQNDCEGVTSLTVNQWIHAAFVYDKATSTQLVYFNGVLEKSCYVSASLNVTPTPMNIGFIPQFNSNNNMGYYQVYKL